MSAAETIAAVLACVVLSITITSALDFVLPVNRHEWAPAVGFTVGGVGCAFFLFRFAGVL